MPARPFDTFDPADPAATPSARSGETLAPTAIVDDVRPARRAAAIVSVVAAAVVFYATRDGLRLSPDSITYIAAAEHLRSGRGLTEFTGEPLTVFPPVFAVLLAPGGDDETWLRVVGAVALAACCWLLYRLLEGRVRSATAVLAAAGCGLSVGMVQVSSSGWSEPVYIAVMLASLLVLRRVPLTDRWCAAAGALAGLSFLTRYAGVGTVVAVAAAVVVATRRWRPTVIAVAASVVIGLAWIARNLVVAGNAMGPRFAGGADEPWDVLLRRPLTSVGTALGAADGSSLAIVIGVAVIVLLIVATWVVCRRRPLDPIDIGVLVLAVVSVLVPLAARMRTASDISPRVMTPLLPCLFYLAAVVVDAPRRTAVRRAVYAAAIGAVVCTTALGLAAASDFPDRGSSGSRTIFSADLHDEIDALDADVQVITNNPWGVWFQNRREPTLFAFTRPRVGNSHRPLEADELLALTCSQPTTLAWFSGLMNAGDGPEERRPDLYEQFAVTLTVTVAGGALYAITPLDPSTCPTSPVR